MCRFASIIIILVLVIPIVGCGPPLRVRVMDEKAVVDVQTLGEYPTTITRVRIAEREGGRTIWEIKAKWGTPQIHTLSLAAGANSVDLAEPGAGGYEIVIPRKDPTFSLQRGTDYVVDVWGSSPEGSPRSAIFQIPK